MISQLANNSKQENRRWSRLPEFTEEWQNRIKGSADFLGLNYYSSRYVESISVPEGPDPSHYRDEMLRFSVDQEWKRAKSEWLYNVPKGLRGLLRYKTISSFPR